MAGILHDVGVGDEPSALNDKAGARPRVLGVASPWLPIVGRYALDGELLLEEKTMGEAY